MEDFKNTIFDTEVGLYKNCFARKMERPIKLYDWIFSEKGQQKYKPLIDTIRAENNAQKRLKLKQELPCITPAGIFKDRTPKLLKFSGFLPIDIDYKDNQELYPNEEDFWNNCKQLINEEVDGGAFVGRSSSNGISGLIYVGDNNKINTPDQFSFFYRALNKYFLDRGPLILDKTKFNLNSLRFYSYDNEALSDLDCGKWVERLEAKDNIKTQYYVNKKGGIGTHFSRVKSSSVITDNNQEKDLVFVIEQSQKLGWALCEDNQEKWFKIGIALANTYGELGRNYFHEISSVSHKYDYQENEKKYSHALNFVQSNSLSIDVRYILKQAKDLGLHYSVRYKEQV